MKLSEVVKGFLEQVNRSNLYFPVKKINSWNALDSEMNRFERAVESHIEKQRAAIKAFERISRLKGIVDESLSVDQKLEKLRSKKKKSSKRKKQPKVVKADKVVLASTDDLTFDNSVRVSDLGFTVEQAKQHYRIESTFVNKVTNSNFPDSDFILCKDYQFYRSVPRSRYEPLRSCDSEEFSRKDEEFSKEDFDYLIGLHYSVENLCDGDATQLVPYSESLKQGIEDGVEIIFS